MIFQSHRNYNIILKCILLFYVFLYRTWKMKSHGPEATSVIWAWLQVWQWCYMYDHCCIFHFPLLFWYYHLHSRASMISLLIDKKQLFFLFLQSVFMIYDSKLIIFMFCTVSCSSASFIYKATKYRDTNISAVNL